MTHGLADVRRGPHLVECLHLRVQDVDPLDNEILARYGKGAKDRMTVLPQKADNHESRVHGHSQKGRRLVDRLG